MSIPSVGPVGLRFFEEFDQLKETVIEINKELVSRSGEPFAVLEEGRLESAIGQVFQAWYTDEQSIAALFKSLIINHPFANGNKRTAYTMLFVLKYPVLTPKELENLTYTIARAGGSEIEINEIANVIYGTNYAVRYPRLPDLDYSDDDDFEDDDYDDDYYDDDYDGIYGESVSIDEDLLDDLDDVPGIGVVELEAEILLDMFGDYFIASGVSDEPKYDYTQVESVWVTFMPYNEEPHYWDLYVKFYNSPDQPWGESLLYSTVQDYLLDSEAKETFDTITRYSVEDLQEIIDFYNELSEEDKELLR